MQGIEILFWGLSVLFILALGFAILLWCRSWRREEREQTERQVRALSEQLERLTSAVEFLEHTSASLQTADEQLSRGIEDLQKNIAQLRTTVPAHKPAPSRLVEPVTKQSEPTRQQMEPEEIPEPQEAAEADRFVQARALLQKGRSAAEVARALDIGAAEVRMIARMMDRKETPAAAPSKPENK